MQTEHLTFYHGTGDDAARAISQSGARDSLFDEIGARALGQEIRMALLTHAKVTPNEDFRLHFAFEGLPGSEYSSLWVPALRELDESRGGSHYSYGQFFATLNIANAYRYAIGNPYRSEFIRLIAECLKLLKHLGDSLPQTVASRFPHIQRAISEPSSPVVLELRGIARTRLLTAKGDDDIDGGLQCFFDMQEFEGFNAPCDFRVRNVTAGDVVAVHDLRDWPPDEVHDSSWRPDPAKVSQVRRLAVPHSQT